MRLYKYRGFENLEFALDIFINQRLYAADFRTLNDPMEGRFIYSKGMLSRDDLRMIRGSKSEYKILSLSANPNNMLMWSYYAQGHQGFVVGVDIIDDTAQTIPINYVDDLKLDHHGDSDLAKQILTKKLKLWDHEQEYRVLVHQYPFVSVRVKELRFGIDADLRQMDLLTAIAEKFCPDVLVSQMNRSDLEMGNVDEF